MAGKYPTQGQKEKVAAILAGSAARRSAAPSYEQNYRSGGSASRATIGRALEKKAAHNTNVAGESDARSSDRALKKKYGTGGGFGIGDILEGLDTARSVAVSGYEQGLHGVRKLSMALGVTDESHVEDSAKDQAQTYALGVLQDKYGSQFRPSDIIAQHPDEVYALSQQWFKENGKGVEQKRAEAKWLNQGPSLDDFATGVDEHRGYGQVLSRATGNDDGAITGNPVADFGIGFAGDVAMDPLTYIAPAHGLGGSSEQVASRILDRSATIGERIAEGHGVRDVIDATARTFGRDPAAEFAAIGRDSANELASKVLREGKSALSKEELKLAFNTTGGMKFNVPGTGRVAKGLGLTTAEEAKQLTVIPKGITDLINRPASAIGRGISESKGGAAIRRAFASADPETQALIREGSTEALELKRAVKTEGQKAAVYGDRATSEYAALSRKFKGHGEDVVRAIEGDGDALARLEAAGIGDSSEALAAQIAKLADDMKAAGVPLAEREQYFPRMLNPEVRDVLAHGQPLEGGKPFFLKGRTNVEGKILSDGTRLSGAEFKIRDTVNRWAEENGLGKNFYEGNPDKVMPSYIAAVSKRIGKQNVINRLVASGIARDAKEAITMIDKGAVNTIGVKAREAIKAGLRGEKAADDAAAKNSAAAAARGKGTSVDGELSAVDSELAHVNSMEAPEPKDLASLLAEGQDARNAIDNPQPFLPAKTRREALEEAERQQGEVFARANQEQVQSTKDRVREVFDNGPTATEAPKGDPEIRLLHDSLRDDPNRLAMGQGDMIGAMDYVESLEKAAKKAGSDEALEHISYGDRALVGDSVPPTGSITPAQWAKLTPEQKAMLHQDAALSLLHDLGAGTTVYQRADEFINASRDATFGTAEFKLTNDRSRATVTPFMDHDDADIAGAAREIESLLNDTNGASEYASAEVRMRRTAEMNADTSRIYDSSHAEKATIDRFDQAVATLDNLKPGWRDRSLDPILGPSPAGTPAFNGGPAVIADGATTSAEHSAFEAMDSLDPGNVKMAEVNDAITAQVRKSQQELGDIRQQIDESVRNLSDDDILRQRERLMDRRAKLWEKASKETDANMRRAGVLQAQAVDAQIKSTRLYKKGQDALDVVAGTATTKQVDRAIEELNTGAFKTLTGNPDIAAPADIADILDRVKTVNTREGMRTFLKHYDHLLNYIKAWQISTPGFHVRNFMGGMFNNYLADMDLGAYRRFLKDRAAYRALPEEARAAAFPEMHELQSVLERGQYSAQEIGAGMHARGEHFGVTPSIQSVNPLSRKNAWLQANTEAGGRVEEILRGTLGYDTMRKGGSLDDAVDMINRYHFDYADLTDFERGTVKRVIPFYTWTRHNFPLQIEMMLQRPGKYARYFQVKNNLELAAGKPEDIVPSYFKDLFAIHTPFKVGGSDAYLTPDLPMTQTMQSPLPVSWNEEGPGLDLSGPASMITPIFKTPIELGMNHQFFKDIPFTDKRSAPPSTWSKIPGFDEALRTAGIADKKGQITDRWAYTIEQYMPLLGRTRRLAPSEEKFQERGISSFLSFLGVPVRLNTQYEKKMEKLRRAFEAQRAQDEADGKTASFEIHYKPKVKK